MEDPVDDENEDEREDAEAIDGSTGVGMACGGERSSCWLV